MSPPNWSMADLAHFEARQAVQPAPDNAFVPVTQERDLHYQILEECRRRVWLPFHGSMAHKARRTPGEPDFIIVTDGGRVLFVECKTKIGKLSTDQLAVAAHAKKLGHEIHVVRSFEEFLKIAGKDYG